MWSVGFTSVFEPVVNGITQESGTGVATMGWSTVMFCLMPWIKWMLYLYNSYGLNVIEPTVNSCYIHEKNPVEWMCLTSSFDVKARAPQCFDSFPYNKQLLCHFWGIRDNNHGYMILQSSAKPSSEEVTFNSILNHYKLGASWGQAPVYSIL
jgi:hypothetical protein